MEQPYSHNFSCFFMPSSSVQKKSERTCMSVSLFKIIKNVLSLFSVIIYHHTSRVDVVDGSAKWCVMCSYKQHSSQWKRDVHSRIQATSACVHGNGDSFRFCFKFFETNMNDDLRLGDDDSCLFILFQQRLSGIWNQ